MKKSILARSVLLMLGMLAAFILFVPNRANAQGVQPTITSVTPYTAQRGSTLTIKGNGFSSPTNSSIFFDQYGQGIFAYPVTFIDPQTIVVTVPASLGNGAHSVTARIFQGSDWVNSNSVWFYVSSTANPTPVLDIIQPVKDRIIRYGAPLLVSWSSMALPQDSLVATEFIDMSGRIQSSLGYPEAGSNPVTCVTKSGGISSEGCIPAVSGGDYFTAGSGIYAGRYKVHAYCVISGANGGDNCSNPEPEDTSPYFQILPLPNSSPFVYVTAASTSIASVYPGQRGATIATYKFDSALSREDVSLSYMKLSTLGTSPSILYSVFQSCGLYNDAGQKVSTSALDGSGNARFLFNSGYVMPKATSRILNVKCDIPTSVPVGSNIELNILNGVAPLLSGNGVSSSQFVDAGRDALYGSKIVVIPAMTFSVATPNGSSFTLKTGSPTSGTIAFSAAPSTGVNSCYLTKDTTGMFGTMPKLITQSPSYFTVAMPSSYPYTNYKAGTLTATCYTGANQTGASSSASVNFTVTGSVATSTPVTPLTLAASPIPNAPNYGTVSISGNVINIGAIDPSGDIPGVNITWPATVHGGPSCKFNGPLASASGGFLFDASEKFYTTLPYYPQSTGTTTLSLTCGGQTSNTLTFIIAQQSAAPSLVIFSPAAGEVLRAGSTYTFRWQAKNMPSNAYGFIRLLNADGTNFDTFQIPSPSGQTNTCEIGTSFTNSPATSQCVPLSAGSLTVTIPDYSDPALGISAPVPTQFKLNILCRIWRNNYCTDAGFATESTGGIFTISYPTRASTTQAQAVTNPPATQSSPTPVTDATSRREAVRQLYLTLQYREPDQQGWDYWTNTTFSIDQIRLQMMNGIEYKTKQKIVSIYQSTLNRAPTTQEILSWYDKVAAAGFNTNIVQQGIAPASPASFLFNRSVNTASSWDGVSNLLSEFLGAFLGY